ncbi:MAG: hypothetical protein ACI88H_001151 [Cocleimonas sp.]|jgi:hypothetical protein
MSKMKQMELMMSSKIDGSVTAVYIETGVPSFKGNPLIECLPKLGSTAEVINRLSRLPKTVLRSAPAGERASELVAALSNIFVGLPQHYDLALFIDTKIKQGYVSRNPCLNVTSKLLQKNYESMLNGNLGSNIIDLTLDNSPTSGIIYGVPGTGKSTSLKRNLSFYNQVIVHESLNLTQITYLYIDFPHDGSLKTLCKNFFDALSHAIRKPQTQWMERRESLDSMLAKMQAAAVRFNIGILIIDEFQFWRSQTKSSDQVIGFLVSLINTIKLPVIFSGTPAAKGRLESNLALARRVTGFDVWDPLQFQTHKDQENNQLWEYFVRKLWQFQYLSKPSVPLTAEISYTWFDCSQGILDIAIKLYIQVQLRAIKSKKEELSSELFRKVYQDDFKPIHSIVNALRSNNPEIIADYPDLPQSNVAMKIATLHKLIVDRQQETNFPLIAPIAQELLDCLIQFGYEKDVALPAVELAFSENPAMDKKSLLPIVIQLLSSDKASKPKSKQKKSTATTKTLPPELDLTQQHDLFSKIVGKKTE